MALVVLTGGVPSIQLWPGSGRTPGLTSDFWRGDRPAGSPAFLLLVFLARKFRGSSEQQEGWNWRLPCWLVECPSRARPWRWHVRFSLLTQGEPDEERGWSMSQDQQKEANALPGLCGPRTAGAGGCTGRTAGSRL